MNLKPETRDEKIKRIAERITRKLQGVRVEEDGEKWVKSFLVVDPTKLAELLVEMTEGEVEITGNDGAP